MLAGIWAFLTEPFEAFKDTETVWDRLLEDRFAVERRMMLQAGVFKRDHTDSIKQDGNLTRNSQIVF